MKLNQFWLLCPLLLCLGWVSQATGADRHAGYYYPEPKEVETYKARARVLTDASIARRIGFVTAITLENNQRPYPPSAVFFAKGDQSQKLIIVSLENGRLSTIFRVRAYLASLTAMARTTPVFRDAYVENILTFFDLVRMLGFEQVTVSDGDQFTHQVVFE